MSSETTNIVNLGPQSIRVKFYRGEGSERKGDTFPIPPGGALQGEYPPEILTSTHFKALSTGPSPVLKVRTRTTP